MQDTADGAAPEHGVKSGRVNVMVGKIKGRTVERLLLQGGHFHWYCRFGEGNAEAAAWQVLYISLIDEDLIGCFHGCAAHFEVFCEFADGRQHVSALQMIFLNLIPKVTGQLFIEGLSIFFCLKIKGCCHGVTFLVEIFPLFYHILGFLQPSQNRFFGKKD